MNKITLIVGNNFNDVNSAVIRKINATDLTKKNIIIVPDRFSLLCEKLVFDTLKISSTFNIDVRGIAGFARYVFEQANLKNEYISKNECKILMRHAIKNTQKKLTVFNGRLNQGIVDMIYDSIVSFKSNQVAPENVCIETSDKFLEAKLKDLQTIYYEYEKLRDGKLDDSEVLNVLEICLENVNLSNYNVYYVNFDGFTKQGYSVLKTIGKFVNSLTVGTCKADNQANSYIFEKEIYDEILTFAKNEDFEVDVEEIPNTLSTSQNILHKNLFALKKEKQKIDFAQIFECNDMKEEISNTAKIIKKLIVKGVRFQDINIICGNLEEYKHNIEDVFDEFGFEYYFDTNVSLVDTNVSKFIFDVLELLQDESSIDDFINVALSDFSGLSKNEKNILKEFTEKFEVKNNLLNEKNQNEEIEKIRNNIAEKINKLKISEKNIKNYLFLIKNIKILFNLEEINNNNIEKFKQLNYLNEEKIYSQVFDGLDDICESLENVLSDEKFELSEFIEIFQDAVSNFNLSTVPLSTDSIFIGDATTSFFEKKKFLFVLGASENNLPLALSDTSILNDDVINEMSSKISLTPTVKMVNRRNRFKLFCNLLQFEEKLFISYSFKDLSSKKLLPSSIVKDLLSIDDSIITIFSSIKLPMAEKVLQKDIANFFAGYLGTYQNAKIEYIKNLKNFDMNYQVILPSIAKISQVDFDKIYNLQNMNLDNTQKLFFNNYKTKISQIEKYYACPFSHFMSYGLGLKEKEIAEVNVMDIGNFLHKIAEEFLQPKNRYVENVSNEKIEKIVEKIIKKIEKNNIFSKFQYKINAISYKIVKDEALRLCKYLYETMQKSNFQPKFLELCFGDKEKFEISVLDNNFSLVGVVDRVDVYKDNAVIIDYKTGASVKGNSEELFYGEKLQVFVYAKALQELKELVPVGVYYFPISNKFSEDNKNPYYLKGKGTIDENFLKNMDTSVTFANPKSEIFPCAISVSKKNVETGEIKYNKNNSLVEKTTFEDMLNYSIEMVKNAIKEILNGNIAISPIQSSCDFCPYCSICQKSKRKFVRTKDFEISDSSFALYKEDENE